MAHIGNKVHRIRDNPLELALHDAWLDIADKGGNILEYLLGDDNRRGAVTDRDEMVAATVIQWLGSPVGQQMLRDVLSTEAGRMLLDRIHADA